MPNNVVLPVTAQTLPAGQCPQTLNALAQLFAANYFVTIPASMGSVITQSARPTVDQSIPGNVWVRLDDLGRFMRVYTFAQGAWLSPAPLQPGAVILYSHTALFTAAPDLINDPEWGGDGTAVSSLYAGPMWEIATEFGGRFPIGVGNLPTSGDAVAFGDAAGEELHTLTVAELPAHKHDISVVTPVGNKWSGSETGGGKITTGNDGLNAGDDTAIAANDPFFQNANTGGGLGHKTIPPYNAVYFLRRTVKQFYVVL